MRKKVCTTEIVNKAKNFVAKVKTYDGLTLFLFARYKQLLDE